MPFVKGQVANPNGRPKGIVGSPRGNHGRPLGQRAAAFVRYDLKQAAKSHCEEGLQVVLACMRDPTTDWSHRIKAVELLWAYGYGRPQVTVEVDTTHRFAVVPAVLSKEEWLKEAEVTRAEQAAKRASEARSGEMGHPTSCGTDIP